MNYQLIRTNKRYGISASISEEGIIVVKAGRKVDAEEIEEFLISHRRWIVIHLKKTLERIEYRKKYLGTDLILLHGVKTQVEYVDGDGGGSYDGTKVTIYTLDNRRESLDKWFFDYAKRYLSSMFDKYARGVCPMHVKRVKTYYGICYTRGNDSYINLNAELVHADDDCIRYVIHHEMAHLKVPNHSKRFYEELARLEPDFRELRRRVKEQVKVIE